MKPPALQELLKARAPLERKRRELSAELKAVDTQLAELGRASTANAALLFISKNPGATTSEVVAASGICPTALSRLASGGYLTNDQERRGRSYYARWHIGPRKYRKAK